MASEINEVAVVYQSDRMTSDEVREVAENACKRAGVNLISAIERKDSLYALVFDWYDARFIGVRHVGQTVNNIAAIYVTAAFYMIKGEPDRVIALKSNEDIWRDAIHDKIAASK